jgi:DNA-binding response OmpR family regulator
MRVLIVEDELVIAIDVEACLAEEGHQIVGIARESETALALGRRLRPDLALVDIQLVDGETGPEIARHLKDMGVPVLFMTANADMLPSDMAGALGAVPKPVAEHVLKGAVRWVADPEADPPTTLVVNHPSG